MPLPQLNGEVEQQSGPDERELVIRGLRDHIRELEENLRVERKKAGVVEDGVREIRDILKPLYGGLQRLFGEVDAMGPSDTPVSTGRAPVQQGSHITKAWDMWKARLGAPCAKIIEALGHGAMTQTQLSIATGINIKNMSTYIYKINKAGLISKNGNEYSLKEL